MQHVQPSERVLARPFSAPALSLPVGIVPAAVPDSCVRSWGRTGTRAAAANVSADKPVDCLRLFHGSDFCGKCTIMGLRSGMTCCSFDDKQKKVLIVPKIPKFDVRFP